MRSRAQICSKRILRGLLSDVNMTYETFSVTRFSHENLSDDEQNDGINFRYTDAKFDCKFPVYKFVYYYYYY